jgi:hypothetical protein
MTARVARMAELLELYATRGAMKRSDVAVATGWSAEDASKAVSNAKAHGYLAFVGEKIGNQQQALELTALGRHRAGLTKEDPRKGTAAAAVDPEILANAASTLILETPGGLDSDQLADKLGVSSVEVEAALAAHAKHRFVTCKVWRDGDDFVRYRESASVSVQPNDWKRPGASAPARAPSPAPAPRCDGVDIDAVHRCGPPRAPVALPPTVDSVTQSSVDDGTQELEADHQQWFALFSTGELNIQRRDGTQIALDQEETRALFQWLDRLGGLDLARLTPSGGEPS